MNLFVETRPAAEFSPCRTWRYVLRREWASGPALGFILLNPSTADETQDDPTIRRCIGYAKAWGYGRLILGNLFAYRATQPRDMRAASDPIGPGNDEALLRIAGEAANKRIVCGWGTLGGFKGRSGAVFKMLTANGAILETLGVNDGGEPKHPLYLRADIEPRPLL